MRKPALLLAATLFSGCSPAYVLHVASGHARLLWSRQSLERGLSDPALSEAQKRGLARVAEIRRFAFERIGLENSRDYSSYAHVDGAGLTFLVSGAERLRLEPYLWSFPVAGSFPYKGFFKKDKALREKRRLEIKGYDAHVGAAAAYNTPLWFSDPVPSTLLDEPVGPLAALILHELSHGSFFFKDHASFNESAATFIGETAAEDFLRESYGLGSPELDQYRAWRSSEAAVAQAFDRLYESLERLYGLRLAPEEVLRRREEIFRAGERDLAGLGVEIRLNNAVLLAERTYRRDLSLFQRAHDRRGRRWPETIRLLRSLNPRDPFGNLRASVGGG
ncbi:MAG: aminopeptidase [Elusimicrobia bacterium]|nr:aminopeptidase [Elusimicrobiota bacterium]